MRAAVYTRISSDRAGAGLGVQRQQADCEQLVVARDWTVAGVFTDNDLSAYSGKPRPSYERLLAAVEAGDINAIVAWHPDRLHRSPVELERFIELVERRHVAVATVQGGEYDLSTAAGRMTARVVGAVARHESEHKSERQRSKHLQLAQAGQIGGGGTRPFGYSCFGGKPEDCELVGCPHDGAMSVIEPEADIIREAARRIAAGEAARGVVADLNKRGVRTSRGKEWAPYSFHRMITSPRIAGLRQHQARRLTSEQRRDGRDIMGPAVWPAIVDRDTWDRVRLILLDPGRRVNRAARRYLLTGLVRCGLCDTKLVARPKADKRRCYVCASGPGIIGCGKIRCLSEPVEELVVEAVLGAFDGPGLSEALQRRTHVEEGDSTGAELVRIDHKLTEADTDYDDDVIDRRAWLNRRQRLTARRDALLSRTATHQRDDALRLATDNGTALLRERWPDLSFDQQRAVLFAVLAQVTINPAVKGRNFFDPDRIDLVWKG